MTGMDNPISIQDANTEAMEAALESRLHDSFFLRLYIAGTSPQSTRAVVNIRKFCETHLKGRYELEIVDLTQNPTLAQTDQVIATPTLIKLRPRPERRFIGELSESARLMAGLGLDASSSKSEAPKQRE